MNKNADKSCQTINFTQDEKGIVNILINALRKQVVDNNPNTDSDSIPNKKVGYNTSFEETLQNNVSKKIENCSSNNFKEYFESKERCSNRVATTVTIDDNSSSSDENSNDYGDNNENQRTRTNENDRNTPMLNVVSGTYEHKSKNLSVLCPSLSDPTLSRFEPIVDMLDRSNDVVEAFETIALPPTILDKSIRLDKKCPFGKFDDETFMSAILRKLKRLH